MRLLVTGEGWSDTHWTRLEGAGFEVIRRPEISVAELRALLPTLDAHLLGGSEPTVGPLLGLVRGLFGQDEALKRGGPERLRTDELGATRVGLVGMGAIAEQVARTLTGSFGCSVTYTNRTRRPDLEEALGL